MVRFIEFYAQVVFPSIEHCFNGKITAFISLRQMTDKMSFELHFQITPGIAQSLMRIEAAKEARVVSDCEQSYPEPPSSYIYQVSFKEETPAEKEYSFYLLNQ